MFLVAYEIKVVDYDRKPQNFDGLLGDVQADGEPTDQDISLIRQCRR